MNTNSSAMLNRPKNIYHRGGSWCHCCNDALRPKGSNRAQEKAGWKKEVW